ncbi:MAG: hypothetical protein JHD16_08695 [Solirubrobacteraceae bacterium]|nr:hypothetical protein [Solirubrobacteraceae bacterium]
MPLAATSLAVLTLAGCTSNTQSCSGGKCDIDLSGKGASVVLGGEGGSNMELISASGKTAKVKLADQEIELTVGEPITLTNATLTLVKVEGEDDIQVSVVTDEGSAAPEGEGEAETESGETNPN